MLLSLPGLRVKRIIAFSIFLVLIAVVAIIGVGWWVPKAQFGCDGSPWGPSTARDAAEGFVGSLVEQDVARTCSVVSSRYDKNSLQDLLKSASNALGDPDSADEVAISLGEQMGSSVAVSLRTATGELGLGIVASANQWRVASVGEE